MLWPHCCLTVPSGDELDPGLVADFEELLGSTKKGVKKVLQRHRALLVRKGVVHQEALEALPQKVLEGYGLLEAEAAVLKAAFPSPTPAGVCNAYLPGSLAWDGIRSLGRCARPYRRS